MRLPSSNLQMLQTSSRSNNSFNIVLTKQLSVSRSIQVTQQQLASTSSRVGWQDHVIGFVVLLSIIIMKHEYIIKYSRFDTMVVESV
jgi:hypothetical protein